MKSVKVSIPSNLFNLCDEKLDAVCQQATESYYNYRNFRLELTIPADLLQDITHIKDLKIL